MTLPPRISKAPKRSSRWRSQAHLSFVRSHHCVMPGCRDVPIEAAHVHIGSGAGLGEKPSDWRAVSLCKHHHQCQHAQGERTFWKAYQTVAGQDVEALIDGYCKASPKAREIRDARNGA